MLNVTPAFQTAAGSNRRKLNFGVLVSWLKTLNGSTSFFTIGTSTIGGPDIIKGAATLPAFFDKYQYIDTSGDALSMSIKKTLARYPWGVIVAQAAVELDNTAKKYLPGFDPTIGSHILPGRPIKLTLGFEGENIEQFTGLTELPTNTLVQRKTTLHAYDVMEYIKNWKLSLGTQVNQTASQILAAILQEIGFTSSQYVIESSLQQPIGYFNAYDQAAGPAIEKLVEAEMGLFFIDEIGRPTFWNRQHLTTDVTVRKAFTYSNISDLDMVNSPIINDVIVKAKPRSVAPQQKIWELQGAVEIPANSSKDIFANFNDDFGSLPVTSIVTPVYIANQSDANPSNYSTNINQDGSGANQNANISLSSTALFGTAYRMTFTNTYSQPIYIRTIELFGTPAKVTTVIEERTSDSASITAYGRNPANSGKPIEIENDYIQTASEARSIGYKIVADNKTPGLRYRLPVFAQPHLQIGDTVSVAIADTGQTKTCKIIGDTKKLARRANLSQELEVQEFTITTYFTIAVSTIGGTHPIAP